MKRLLATFAAVCLLAIVPSQAFAGPIVDPIIGVRGGDFGSVDITTSTPLLFNDACPADLASSGFSCLAYKITQAFDTSGVFSVVLNIANTNGGGFLTFQGAVGTGDAFFVTDLNDGSHVQLTAAAPVLFSEVFIPPPVFQCRNAEGYGFHACHAGDDLLIYVKPIPDSNEGNNPIFTSSVESVNGQPVPEPATLLLIGTGMATLAGRRLRRKNS